MTWIRKDGKVGSAGWARNSSVEKPEPKYKSPPIEKTKLNWDDIAEIRRLSNEVGMSNKKIADRYKKSSTAISNIVNNKTWVKK